jgi:excisionase family DNA binding protein
VDALITADELAKHLRIAVSTVRAWVRLTDLPRYSVGRLVRFHLAEVLQWLQEGGSLAKGRRTHKDRQQSGAAARHGGANDGVAPSRTDATQ